MRVRGTASVHFLFEYAGALSDDDIRQAVVDSFGTHTTAYEDVKIEAAALSLEDITIDRGADA